MHTFGALLLLSALPLLTSCALGHDPQRPVRGAEVQDSVPAPGAAAQQAAQAVQPAVAAAGADTAEASAAPSAPPPKMPGARWEPASWGDLPGFESDQLVQFWPAWQRSCERPTGAWQATCEKARALGDAPSESALRAWMRAHLQVFGVVSPQGEREGLITGYYEPVVVASRQPAGPFRIALHQPPADLAQRQPYWTRQQLDTHAPARAALRGREIAYVRDPLDLLVLQIQGSGRLMVSEPDGSQRTIRVAYAAHNGQPYQSIGRWLVRQGAMTVEQASWPAIKAWAQAHPKRLQEMLWANPRVVFFREEVVPEPAIGPVGAQGVPLTAGRSVAVDPRSIPYGTPVWLDTTHPQPWRREPPPPIALQRMVMAQDTGSAIVGAVRADYYWGTGLLDASPEADNAGRMRQPLRLWVLWPK